MSSGEARTKLKADHAHMFFSACSALGEPDGSRSRRLTTQTLLMRVN